MAIRAETWFERAWKRLATPKFGRRAEIGGGELMNIGWEWGVLDEGLSLPEEEPGRKPGIDWLRPGGLYPSVIQGQCT
jgi:hypothetical protein